MHSFPSISQPSLLSPPSFSPVRSISTAFHSALRLTSSINEPSISTAAATTATAAARALDSSRARSGPRAPQHDQQHPPSRPAPLLPPPLPHPPSSPQHRPVLPRRPLALPSPLPGAFGRGQVAGGPVFVPGLELLLLGRAGMEVRRRSGFGAGALSNTMSDNVFYTPFQRITGCCIRYVWSRLSSLLTLVSKPHNSSQRSFASTPLLLIIPRSCIRIVSKPRT